MVLETSELVRVHGIRPTATSSPSPIDHAHVRGKQHDDLFRDEQRERAQHAVRHNLPDRFPARFGLVDRLHAVRFCRQTHRALESVRFSEQEDRTVRLSQEEEADKLDKGRELRTRAGQE